jgi:hypothetical protein
VSGGVNTCAVEDAMFFVTSDGNDAMFVVTSDGNATYPREYRLNLGIRVRREQPGAT